ncbi:hypothetical protein LSH36_563g03040 [Paralvinella palmiformis]|uniref:Insulin receptor substrate 1 n=1 Tax=Paralvinella palmiformis TaxID=53620 RepID=A0AAD9J730_9ANNE|nr:hypothetical protein LSH36_563g03040 [Paralvinella palmiformis]
MSTNVDTQRDVKRMGYLKKQKTMKKKLFVLREESENGPARLEYYDSEKKFVCSRPKRSIHLHNCFSINAKSDSKHKYAIVLYTREDCFTVICENESDHKEWLSAMINLRNYHTHGNSACPLYEHIWPVTVKSKGLGSSKHLSAGQYRLCLMPKEISFIRQNRDTPDLVLQLASIRKCGHTECFFYLEPGRMAVTGSGVLWMQVEDAVIAQNMHEAILSFMTASSMSADQPTFRTRRHTVTDKSKPSNLPVKQHSTPHATSTMPVTRSKTMSAADQPASETGHRSRTDSTDSSFSRNTNSFSADELDSPGEELCAGSSTPTRSSDPYVTIDRNPLDFGLSPVPNRQSSVQCEADDYFDMESVSRPVKFDTYMEMEMTKEPVSTERVMTRSRSTQHSREFSHGANRYVDMALHVNKEEVNTVSDEGSVDSGVRLDCTRAGMKGKASGPATPCQEHLDADEYILMNSGTGTLEESSYIDMSQNSSVAASPALSTSSSLHDVPADSHYLPMSGGSRANSVTEQDEYFEVSQDSLGYMAMAQTGSSPRLSNVLRPDRVCSYLADENTEQTPLRSSSLGSRSQLLQSKSLTESYLDMQKGQEVANSGERASSTPMLSRTASHKDQRKKGHGGKSADRKQLSKETLEEKDFLMEMNFNHRCRHGKEHEYEDVRPRSSSGGSHDFRNRTLSSGSQERRRTGSFGYREKLSKIASLARANIREHQMLENGHGHRQRMATICQESFHKRTSSFGAAISDMRPRSSSHGNARYMDMTGRAHVGCSHASSHDCLHRLNKRGSQELVTSDYLDMRPRVSTLPSQALVGMFKNKDHSRRSPRSPLLTDSDYLSMDHGRSSGESSAEYTSMDLHAQKSPEDQHHQQRGKSRTKRGSTSSKVSFSSSESLTSNTSQSSDGRSLDRQRAVVTSPILDNLGGHAAKSKRSSKSSLDKELRPVIAGLDDSYVLYSPVSSRESSPLPGSCAASLEKVSSPIRAGDDDSELVASTAVNPAPSRGDKKHDYVNVDYDRNKGPDVRTKNRVPSVAVTGPTSTASSPVSLMHHEMSVKIEAPSIPCPKAPISDGSNTSKIGVESQHSDEVQSSDAVHSSVHVRSSENVADQVKDTSGKGAASKLVQPKTSHLHAMHNTRDINLADRHDDGSMAGHGDADSSPSPHHLPAIKHDYMVITPGQTKAKPTTPVPFPSLEPIVSPIRDEMASETPEPFMVLPMPPSVDDDYIEVNIAEKLVVDTEQELTSGSMSVAIGNIHTLPAARSSAGEMPPSSPHSGSSPELSALGKLNAGSSEVNYATLDLHSAGDEPNTDGRARPKHASGGSSAGSDSPDEMPLQYAQIDFNKSEQLRKSNAEKKTRAPFDL